MFVMQPLVFTKEMVFCDRNSLLSSFIIFMADEKFFSWKKL